MNKLTSLLVAFCAVAPIHVRALDVKPPEGWTEGKRSPEVVVFFKDNEKAQARDILAYAELEASPEAAFKVITDVENLPKFMPYIKEAKVFSRTSPTDFVQYQRMAAPMIPERDYFLHTKLTRGTKANGGVFKSEWTSEPDTEPEKPGIVRMRINEGSWTFEPLDGGKRSRVIYSVLTNPGGGIPKWQTDQGSIDAVPNLFKAVREQLLKAPTKAPSASH